MIKLRELQKTDAKLMHILLNDKQVTHSLVLGRNFNAIENIIEFIESSWNNKKNIHLAISNEKDEYIGTISLKNIDYINRNAEYAIILRKEFWGQNVANIATDEILKYGFNKLNLKKIYLDVASINARAINFYEKYGFKKEGVFFKHIFIDGAYSDLIWYSIFSEDYVNK